MKPAQKLSITAAALVAFAVMGLTYPRPVVASALFSVVFLIVAASIVAAFLRSGRERVFWIGFAVFATPYFILSVFVQDVWLATNSQLGIGSQPPRPGFITSYLLAYVYDHLGGPEMWTGGGTRVPAIHLVRVSRELIPRDMDVSGFEAFINIGHCLFTVLAGLLGAWVASWFYRPM